MITRFEIFLKNIRKQIIRINITLSMRIRYILRVFNLKN